MRLACIFICADFGAMSSFIGDVHFWVNFFIFATSWHTSHFTFFIKWSTLHLLTAANLNCRSFLFFYYGYILFWIFIQLLDHCFYCCLCHFIFTEYPYVFVLFMRLGIAKVFMHIFAYTEWKETKRECVHVSMTNTPSIKCKNIKDRHNNANTKSEAKLHTHTHTIVAFVCIHLNVKEKTVSLEIRDTASSQSCLKVVLSFHFI